MADKKYGIRIRSGAEIEQQERLKKRDALLERLNNASAKRKKTKPAVAEKPRQQEIRRFGQNYDNEDEYADFLLKEESRGNEFNKIPDEEWDRFIDQIETAAIDDLDSSPVDNATTENIMGFWEPEESDDPYADLFKDEIAMVSEVLKELKEQGKLVSQRLKSMTGKGAGGGAPKSFSDLVSASSSLQSTKLSAIDKIAGWKLKRAELQLKAKKDNPDVEENVDALVDQYYGRFLSGDRRQYIANAMAAANPDGDDSNPLLDQSYDDSDDAEVNYGGFNITDPGSYEDQPDDDLSDVDPYGYIRNEGRDVEVCVQRFPSGRTAFVALDANGESVDDYELPDSRYLDSLNIRPTSRYATDMTGRRYRIIDFDPDEDISDV